MNTYITVLLNKIKKILATDEILSFDTIDSVIGEIEMIKMEIEQHITNMPQVPEYQNLRSSAQSAVLNLSEILDLLDDLLYAGSEEYKDIISDVSDLIDEISY